MIAHLRRVRPAAAARHAIYERHVASLATLPEVEARLRARHPSFGLWLEGVQHHGQNHK